nr:DNA-binding transcriptional regulator CytR [Leminorella richardii]
MRDVAVQAGVSAATVSRTLMMPDKVSAQTRDRVEQAIAQTGYIPVSQNKIARQKGSRILLVMAQDITDPFSTDVMQGIQETAEIFGYTVLFLDNRQQSVDWETLSPIMRQVDGAVLLGARFPFGLSAEERALCPPMVMANEYLPELKLPTIHIDNLTAAFNAVLYLQHLGHCRIACICGPSQLHLSHYRQQGYIQALQRGGIAIEKSYILEGPLTFESGASALSQLMALPQPPSAIFCHSDIVAIGAIHQAKQQGLKVPQDLSVIGFDDISMAKYADPPLTTVAQPRYQIGKQAVQMLLELLEGNPEKRGSILLDSELIVRDSTAPL